MTYPSLLAAGVTDEGTFTPDQLFAGEADIISSHGTCGASAILQFQCVARDEDGLIVPYNELTGAASKAGTFSAAGTATDTITINGQVFTLVSSGAGGFNVLIGADAPTTATNFAAAVNANPDTTHVRATRSGAVVTLYALEAGTGGNSIAIAESSTSFSFAGGATALSGGAAEGENKAIGIAAQPATSGEGVPFFTGGIFNADLVIFPAELVTLAQKQGVFDRTNIGIDVPKGVSSNITYT